MNLFFNLWKQLLKCFYLGHQINSDRYIYIFNREYIFIKICSYTVEFVGGTCLQNWLFVVISKYY